MRKFCCVLFCSTVWGLTFGQTPELLMEELAQSGKFNKDDWEEILESRLSLNEATQKELQMTGFLSMYQVQSLLDYRKRYGDFLTWAEIPIIPGFTEKDAQWLALFFTLEPKPSSMPLDLRSLIRHGKRSLMLQTRTFFPRGGYYAPITEQEYRERPNSRYLGLPWYRYARYNYNYYGKLKWGVTLESDPGERALADYVSCHLSLKNKGFLKSLVAGDFRARFGQGLLLWNGSHFGASLSPSSLFNKEMGLTAYTSRDENKSFRGAGATFSANNFDISVFGSYRRLDARIIEEGFTSLVETGYHRTPLETEKKNTLGAWAAGVNASYKGDGWKLGATALGYGYSKPDAGNITYYNRFKNRNLPFGGMAVDYSARFGNWLVFSEMAMDAGLSPAFLGGVIRYGSEGARDALVLRLFSPSFTSAYGTDAGRNSTSSNEISVQFSSSRNVLKKWTLTGNAWFYYFPVSRYLCHDRSYGWDYRIRLQRENHLISLCQQRSISDKGITDKQSLRLQTAVPLTESLSLGLRADGVMQFRYEKEVLPARATLYSALLPGLGQIYNRDYWKIPIIYGGLIACGYFWQYNGMQYQRYKTMYNHATANPSEYDGWMTPENIKWYRDSFRRYRDYSIIATVLVYALNIIDANVFAHFQDFDISDDLTLRIEPGIIPVAMYASASYPGAGIQMRLTF